MKKAFSISVKKPCSQKFENFSKTSSGGFCPSCQKDVIDFTNMSQTKLIPHFTNSNNTTCGRFKTSQLQAYELASFNRNSTNFLSKSVGVMSFSLLSLCAVSNIQAQEELTLDTTIQTEISTVQKQETIKANLTVNGKYTVKGTVLDEENLPLGGVSVVLKGTGEGVTTDFDGKFEFPKALDIGDILVFNYIGYDTKKYTVTKSKSQILDITITFEASDIELMGEVAVGGVYTTKRNIFQKIAGIFK